MVKLIKMDSRTANSTVGYSFQGKFDDEWLLGLFSDSIFNSLQSDGEQLEQLLKTINCSLHPENPSKTITANRLLSYGQETITRLLDIVTNHSHTNSRIQAVQILENLASIKLKELQLLTFPISTVSTLLPLQNIVQLVETLPTTPKLIQIHILQFLVKFTGNGNLNIKRHLAYEGSLPHLVTLILDGLHDTDGVIGMAVEVVDNLLVLPLNRYTFHQGGHLKLVIDFFESLMQSANSKAFWTDISIRNMLTIFRTVNALVSPDMEDLFIPALSDRTPNHQLFLSTLTKLLSVKNIPDEVMTQAINVIGYLLYPIDHEGLSETTTNALFDLLFDEKQTFQVRTASVYCFQCLLRNSSNTKCFFMKMFSSINSFKSVSAKTAGELLFSGLQSADPISCWGSSIILAHCLIYSVESKNLLLEMSVDFRPFVDVAADFLHQSNLQSKLGFLILLSTWAANYPPAAAAIAQQVRIVQFLIKSTKSAKSSDEHERFLACLSAFLLAVCLRLYNDSKEDLGKRIRDEGVPLRKFLDQLSYLTYLPLFLQVAKHPERTFQVSALFPLDVEFFKLYDHQERALEWTVKTRYADFEAQEKKKRSGN